MLEPRGKGLVGISLHYANEVHQDSGYFEEIPDIDIPREMLDLAKHIIAKMTGKFDPSEFEDRYENALIELIRSKQKGVPVKAQPVQRQTNVINLMDALRRSVEGAGAPSGAPTGAKGGAERAPDKKAEKAPARKAEKTEKAAPKARSTAAKAKARKAG